MNKWSGGGLEGGGGGGGGGGGVGAALPPNYRQESAGIVGQNYPLPATGHLHANYSDQLLHPAGSYSSSNSYHGDPYIPADVFNVSFLKSLLGEGAGWVVLFMCSQY